MKSKIIKDTIINGERIITFELYIWRPIWVHLVTYRRASRNSSSSRAIPVDKMKENFYFPELIGKKHNGMMPNEFLQNEELDTFLNDVKSLSNTILAFIDKYKDTVSKSILNRFLEPFTMNHVLFTTNIASFQHIFKQRCSKKYGDGLAEPNLSMLVDQMYENVINNNPIESDYHVPFWDDEINNSGDFEYAAKIAGARCARISYTPHDLDKIDIDRDLQLSNKLIQNGHYSPFEHCIINKELVNYPKHPFLKKCVSFRQYLEANMILNFDT